MAAPAVHGLATAVPDTEAPGALGLVEAFVNTVTYNDDDPADEQLADPSALTRWLEDHGLRDGGWVADASDLRHARAVREALRDLLEANHDAEPPSRASLDLLSAAANRAPLTVVLDAGDHATLAPAGAGIDRAVGALLAVVLHAMHDGTWQRLKACRNDGCRWAFYDDSRNRSGRWCDMAVCGNRAKVRAYRDRHG